jgi:hypothetical protein
MLLKEICTNCGEEIYDIDCTECDDCRCCPKCMIDCIECDLDEESKQNNLNEL